MKKITFGEGVVVAFVFAFVSIALHRVLGIVFYPIPAEPILASILTVAYSSYLIYRSKEKIGRIVCVVGIGMAVVVSWSIGMLHWTIPLVFLGAVVLVRAHYYHRSVLVTFADLLLQILAIGFALWVFIETNNTFLVVWAFFLTQALFVFIKPFTHTVAKPVTNHRSNEYSRQSFVAADKQANLAIKKLSHSV